MQFRSRKRDLKLALPFLFLLAGLLLFEQRGLSDAQASPVSLSNFHKVVSIFGAFFLSGWVLLKNTIPRPIPGMIITQCMYLIIAVVSIIMAGKISIISYWKFFELLTIMLVTTYMICTILRKQVSPEFYLNIILGFFRGLLIITMLGAIIDPSQAIRPPLSEETLQTIEPLLIPYQLRGVLVTINPNSLGAISAILALFYLIKFLDGKWTTGNALWLVLAICVLLLSQSRTSIVAFLVALTFSNIINRRLQFLSKIAFLFIVICGLIILSEDLWSLLSRGMDTDRLSNLSGREYWWSVALARYGEADVAQQVFGLGYYSANREILSSIGHEGSSSLHSDYIDTIISTGALGLAIFILFLIYSVNLLFKLWRCDNSLDVSFLIGAFLILLTRSLTGQTLMVYGFFQIFILTILVLAYGRIMFRRDTF